MIQQFNLNPYVQKQLSAYLDSHNIGLTDAMNDETHNNAIAAIIHENLPGMVKKIYSLKKMQTFFWEKKDLLMTYIAQRLAAGK